MNKFCRFVSLCVVPLASFLTFIIQPIAGKSLLFAFGGKASIWLTALVFFQAILLCGYLLAFILEKCSKRTQVTTLGLVSLLALFSLDSTPSYDEANFSQFNVAWTLFFSLGPALLLTTSVGIVFHGWLRSNNTKIPYFLYALSNIGSVSALGAFPFFIEPNIGIQQLGFIWTLLFILLVVMLAVASYGFLKCGNIPEAIELEKRDECSRWKKLSWLGIPFLLCVMLAVTTQDITHEIGSHPLSWTIPLCIFLLAYTVGFFGFLKLNLLPWLFALVLTCLSIFVLKVANLQNSWIPSRMISLLMLQASISLSLVTMLYHWRPKGAFGMFYVMNALGGVMGGLAISVLSPMIFSCEIELFFALTAIVLVIGIGICLLLNNNVVLPFTIFSIVVISIVGRPLWELKQNVEYFRNIYGLIELHQHRDRVSMLNGRILHGTQFIHPQKSQTPTTYFWEGSAIGIMIKCLQAQKTSLRIGVIGLGAGTLATYLRAEDEMIFWDIDPNSKWIAENVFTFLAESKGKISIQLVDGRKGIESISSSFDLIVVDAFSGDGVPPHLLTVEAVELYQSKAPNGILAFNATNAYLHVQRVLSGSAERLELETVIAGSAPDQKSKRDTASHLSYYFFITKPENIEALDTFIENFLAYEGAQHVVGRNEEIPRVYWTDDKNNMWSIIKNKPF